MNPQPHEQTGVGKDELPKDSVLRKIIPPHPKISRIVTDKDISRVIESAKILYEICFTPMGRYQGAYAMHHSQIDDKDPLSFFVTHERNIVINPVIVRHSNYFVDSKEACRSFNEEPQIIVPRWQKIEVDFFAVMVDPKNEKKFKLSSIQHESLSGFPAFIWQHEIDHGLAKFIYPFNSK
jgi:hypothetical protein